MPSILLLARQDTVFISVRLSLELGNGHVNKCQKIRHALCPGVSTEHGADLKGGKIQVYVHRVGRVRELALSSVKKMKVHKENRSVGG